MTTRGNEEWMLQSRPYPEGSFFSSDNDLNQEGWQRKWADVTQEGVIVVYRREVSATDKPKLNPYIMAPKRVAYVNVLGRLWMGSIGAYTYELSDHDLSQMDTFTRENIDQWLATHSGDFAGVIDFFAQCGQTEVPWESPDNEMRYNDAMEHMLER